ncbi:Stp1/IreP family PP2C-type Ser/Thr phosphatase [Stomatohabitans albus]|uniref:Stp1/IreP family PP2C-type Ser/Thr phosphatase n=1 Tax=Stomatohabitans albus TaxID=3110766 RepID=UPI00300D7B61
MTVISIHARTSTGRVRDHNEDSYYAGDLVAAVADGMGGHAAGEVASNLALQPVIALEGVPYPDAESATKGLVNAVLEANELVLSHATDNPDQSGMGTTLTAVLMREGALHLAHVGDSRAYLFRDGTLTQLTTDHTLVNRLVQEGHLSEEEAKVHPHRSVITRAIGVDSNLDVDTLEPPLPMVPGDRFLLCSDGLSGPVSDEQIAAILANERIPERACRRLVDAANSNGGPDNITTIIIDVLNDGESPEPTLHLTDDEATAELADPQAIAAHVPKASHEPIDTAPPLVPPSAKPLERRHPPKRSFHPMIWVGLGLGMCLALVVTSVTVLNNQIYVSIDPQGNVAIYRGLKDQHVFGVPLFSVIETQTLKASSLSEPLRIRLAEGVSQTDEDAARAYINETLRESSDREENDQTSPEASPMQPSEPSAAAPLAPPASAQPPVATPNPNPSTS